MKIRTTRINWNAVLVSGMEYIFKNNFYTEYLFSIMNNMHFFIRKRMATDALAKGKQNWKKVDRRCNTRILRLLQHWSSSNRSFEFIGKSSTWIAEVYPGGSCYNLDKRMAKQPMVSQPFIYNLWRVNFAVLVFCDGLLAYFSKNEVI